MKYILGLSQRSEGERVERTAMPEEVAIRITEIDAQGQEHLVAELNLDQALDYLDHIDAQYEAYRRVHPEKNLEPLPPGAWEQYLDWAIQRQGDESHAYTKDT